jgi:hypothetical protein
MSTINRNTVRALNIPCTFKKRNAKDATVKSVATMTSLGTCLRNPHPVRDRITAKACIAQIVQWTVVPTSRNKAIPFHKCPTGGHHPQPCHCRQTIARYPSVEPGIVSLLHTLCDTLKILTVKIMANIYLPDPSNT